jgi:hypothetical protein
MTDSKPELPHSYSAIYLNFHKFTNPFGHLPAATLVINRLDRLTRIASFLVHSPERFSSVGLGLWCRAQ